MYIYIYIHIQLINITLYLYVHHIVLEYSFFVTYMADVFHPPIRKCPWVPEVLHCHLELRRDELKVDEAPGDCHCGFV